MRADLVDAFQKGRAAVFVGAGASMPAGLPSWSGLLEELVAETKNTPAVSEEWTREYERLAKDPAKNLVLASALKDDLAHNFSNYIERRFGDDALEPSDVHRALVELPAQFFITTNYDHLLERAYAEKHAGKRSLNSFTFRQVGQAASSLFRNKPFVLHVHGDAKTEPDRVVLTEKDYRLLIHNEAGFQSLLQTLFTTFTILFVGTSLNDIEVRLLLGFIHSSFHGKTPTHVALMPDKDSSNTEVRLFFRDFNIEVIHMDHRDLSGAAVNFLAELKAAIG